MKHSRIAAVAVLVPWVLAGCGSSDTQAKKEPMPMEDTIYGGQIKQMNKIREETTKMSTERMDNLNKQLENNGQ